ncbi:hypothetical protein Tsubulata_021519 [Turnera subulata]|uniref:F-box domain-containing protein n=1 Tax=Turnera subulata TaxID=218843 RepID=A0A9Q0FRK8_9ROSI|nr:hypothetical protein Tsubulata_021519 [Turnera subulata]
MDGVDRLSQLPDEIFLQILSKIDDGKSIHRICSLSKQWLKLPDSFTQDFVYDGRDTEEEYYTNRFTYYDSRQRYLHHMQAALLAEIRKAAKVGKLEYTYKVSQKERLFQDDLFKLARDRHVQCLILHAYSRARGCLSYHGPSCLRKFTSLTTLHLTNFCFDLEDPEFPRVLVLVTIRSLVLVDCVIRGEFGCDFSTCWPNLEELQMVGCRFQGFKEMQVKVLCGSKLAKLTMESNKFGPGTEISGDGVKWFRFVQQFTLHQVLPELKLQSLEHAEVDVSYHIRRDPTLELNLNELICLMWRDEEDQDDCRTQVCLSLFDLLRGLGNAEFLSLSPATVQVLSEVPAGLVEDQPSLFRRLKCLKLEGNLISSVQQEIPDEVKTFLLRDCPSATLIY